VPVDIGGVLSGPLKVDAPLASACASPLSTVVDHVSRDSAESGLSGVRRPPRVTWEESACRVQVPSASRCADVT